MIVAIDPGNTKSAWVVYDADTRKIVDKGILPNADMLAHLDGLAFAVACPNAECAIEMIASYGMSVGAEIFETVYWIGRFAERWWAHTAKEATRVYRKEVKIHLCGTSAAKDPNVRQALIDMFGPGKDLAIGKKRAPGPLFGVHDDVWSALAVAVTFAAQRSTVAAAAINPGANT